MKYFGYCFILILILTAANQAQGKKIQFEFLPPGLNFAPLKANMQEAKIGVLYFPDNSNLKVDIGNNADLVKINFPRNEISIASGIEFMGYALSTNYKEFRLQIDALDGFFGGNVTFKKSLKRMNLISGCRLFTIVLIWLTVITILERNSGLIMTLQIIIQEIFLNSLPLIS